MSGEWPPPYTSHRPSKFSYKIIAHLETKIKNQYGLEGLSSYLDNLKAGAWDYFPI